ncbi:MAG: succinate dehydrogenase, cytochrome b556 subunit [Woeseia sp.]|jgi:succinate dehydrogenase / fumarate reductase, cytochrome b subunit|nr:succinate dehydrogenase, cytochrome b556 subunit [Woeseia sp.]MBT6211205.1 succinate dehydrogenase, cytochrome b556 subunit [Woeseia sp.]
MSNDERPISPHLTVYRWPITMTLSILHRMTGFALSAGLVAFVVWLEAIAWDVIPYATFYEVSHSALGQIALLGWLFSFFFHLCNGVRHLIWDSGRLFEKSQAIASSWLIIISAVVLTTCYWLLV